MSTLTAPRALNLIGLDAEKTADLANGLNQLLANFEIHYQNLRALHWNIRGQKFFELHLKFEELYTDAQEKVDLVAERILTLGHTPLHTFSDYLHATELPEARNIHEGREAVDVVLNGLGILLRIERELLAQAGEANDEGTVSLMSDFINEQEKTVWMLSAWLSE